MSLDKAIKHGKEKSARSDQGDRPGEDDGDDGAGRGAGRDDVLCAGEPRP